MRFSVIINTLYNSTLSVKLKWKNTSESSMSGSPLYHKSDILTVRTMILTNTCAHFMTISLIIYFYAFSSPACFSGRE